MHVIFIAMHLTSHERFKKRFFYQTGNCSNEYHLFKAIHVNVIFTSIDRKFFRLEILMHGNVSKKGFGLNTLRMNVHSNQFMNN